MARTIHQNVTIQQGGRIVIMSPDLPEGAEADVVVSVHDTPRPEPRYRALFGSGKGGFATSEEADAFLRTERDAWDS